MPYIHLWPTVIETAMFTDRAARVLTDLEREALAVYLARHPRAGTVIPQSGGIRKLRWASRGSGKRGGARIVYYNRLDNGEIWLLTLYTKSTRSAIPANELRKIKQELDDGR